MASKREITPAEALLQRWAAESINGVGVPDFDPDFSNSFPNLWVLMTWREVGSLEKLPGRISFSADGTGWRVTYSDPTAKRSATVVAETLMGALRKLDEAIISADTVWSGRGTRNASWRKRKSD
jgi:hypothetical protein